MEFITLDPLPRDRTVNTATQFTLTRGKGEIRFSPTKGDVRSFPTKDELIAYLHEYVDLVRTNRISAARDTHHWLASSSVPEGELERSTVRVFFLTDVADPDSLTSAADYAALLRKKSEEYDNPLRSGRDERISPIVICMNADRPPQDNILTPSTFTPFDMVIPLCAYRDDEGFVGNDAQIYELELILYTLLLVPESLAMLNQEMRDKYLDDYLTHGDLDEVQPSPLHSEVCMLGIASLKYSANWARRWLDYGLVKKLLQTVLEPETVGDKSSLCLPDGRDWLESWWADVKTVLPRTLVDVIPSTKGLSAFQRCITASSFHGVPLRDSQRVLEDFCQDLGRYYAGDQGATLEQAFQSATGDPIIEGELRRASGDGFKQTLTVQAQLKDLQGLQRRANLFSVSLFKGAVGAIPRAISQLSELESRIKDGEIERYTGQVPNFLQQYEQFEEQAKKAQYSLASALHIWQLPLVGRVLRSTLLSLFLVVFIVFCIWFLQDSLSFLPDALTYSLPKPAGVSLFRLFVLILLASANFFLPIYA